MKVLVALAALFIILLVLADAAQGIGQALVAALF